MLCLLCNVRHMDTIHTMFEPSMTSGLQNVGTIYMSRTFLVIVNDRERDTTSSYCCDGLNVVGFSPNTECEGQHGSWGMFIARLSDLDFAYEISLCYEMQTMRQKHKYLY
jgi:hypothetical protein